MKMVEWTILPEYWLKYCDFELISKIKENRFDMEYPYDLSEEECTRRII